MKRFWRDLTTTDFEADVSDWIAVLPVAAIEQHGPHLPLGTDTIIAEGMIERAALKLPPDSKAVFLPLQEVGKSSEHVNFPGTLTFDWDTTVNAWLEIGESVAMSGIEKLVIITSHGGNTACMEIVARELRQQFGMVVVTTSWEKLGPPRHQPDGDETYIDIHGGDLETSLMLALSPDHVDMSKAKHFESQQSMMKQRFKHLGYHSSTANISWMSEDLNPKGTVGDASVATAEKGKEIVKTTIENFIGLIEEIADFTPPTLS